jgi:hypothetical protein
MSHKTYMWLNEGINDTFFDGRFRMAPVYLDIEAKVAEDLSETLVVDEEDLEAFVGETVAETLHTSGTNPYQWHLDELSLWEQTGRTTPPPFTGLLCAFSMAAERMRGDSSFSATNYYVRLFQLFGITSPTTQQRLKQNARYTRRFWRALNLWLAENDFEYGRPTARPVNSWKYVSFALSQALVRDGDRKRLSDLFERNNLEPGTNISESEMLLFLDEWMIGSGPTAWIKKLWLSADLRPRIVASAMSELESWEGMTASDGSCGPAGKRLSWRMSMVSFPKKRLDLSLVLNGDADHPNKTLQYTNETGPIECEGTPPVGEIILSASPSDGYSRLGPASQLDLGHLLLSPVEFSCSETEETFKHAPKPIIPLMEPDIGVQFREVPRLSLHRKHHILCHENWLTRVVAVLNSSARPNFDTVLSKNIAGLPDSWVLIKNVEMVVVPRIESDHLSALVPIATGHTIELVDGLPLAQNVWHSQCPPTVSSSATDGNFELVVLKETYEDDDHIIAKASSTDGSCTVTIGADNVQAGEHYRALTIKGSNERSEKHFTVRNANVPRAIKREPFGYPLASGSHGLGLLSQLFDEVSIDAPRATGLSIPPIEFAEHAQSSLQGLLISNRTDGSDPSRDVESNETYNYQTSDLQQDEESCIIRGFHYWIVDAFNDGDNKSDAKWMTCNNCRVRTTSRMSAAKTKGRARSNSRAPAPMGPIAERTQGSIPTLDTVFDGLCYLGDGSWPRLIKLLSTQSDEPYATTEAARTLVDLGHIDTWSRTGFSPTRWQIAPATLAFNDTGRCFLAGYRSASLIDEVGDCLEASGASYTPIETVDNVTVHAWRDIDAGTAETALAELRDPHGRPIVVVPDAARRLSAWLPSLGDMISSMASVTIGAHSDAERFDASEARWHQVDDITSPGAYRLHSPMRRYVVRTNSGEAFECPFEIAKTAAAAMNGTRIHGYDASKRAFVAALGCEPPGLFRRALVACSGQLPAKFDGRIYYYDVPADLAADILEKLYEKGNADGGDDTKQGDQLHQRRVSVVL